MRRGGDSDIFVVVGGPDCGVSETIVAAGFGRFAKGDGAGDGAG